VTHVPASNLAITDIALRLGLALLYGGIIGLNRDLHHKRAGLRTFGLVALATAGMTLGMLGGGSQGDLANESRVVQGILTGIGFLGAGVILHRPESGRTTGLTTAAAIWFTAGLAVLCGLGELALAAGLFGIAFALLLTGRRIEAIAERWFGQPAPPDRRDEPGSGDVDTD
jgi:putative Mg2+ transporter-C (MgtC) family protein